VTLFSKTGSKARRQRESGYILITLMLMASLVVILLAAVLPKISQQLARDREEEMVHRGVQYSRAIRRYYKKFGRYPTRVEELESSNNLRFLRQRYKDPISGKDFKLLHFGEVKMNFGAGIAGGVAPGANAIGGINGDPNANQGISGNGPQLRPLGQAQVNPQPGGTSDTGDSSDPNSSSSGSSGGPGGIGKTSGPLSSGGFGSSANSSGNPTFGGGPIVGVVSVSTKTSIREYNKKNHYNDWQFIYDPSSDRGGLLNTPAQPPLQNAVAPQGNPGGQIGPTSNPPGVPTLSPGMTPNNPMGPPNQPPDQAPQ
jgi:type II secretory pathway pseudopilin PulG